MTHAELRALLPGYAAGQLDVAEAEAVRAHLATGCEECLRDLFTRPVGLPRPAALAEAPRVSAAVPPPRGARLRLLPVVLVLLALALGALAGWTILDRRAREAAGRAETAAEAAASASAATATRLGALEATRGALAARLESVERARAAAEAEAARQAAAARASAEESAGARRELEAAATRIETLTRGVRRRDGEIDRLLTSVDAQGVLRELVTTPGVEMLRLTPVAPFADVHGHVLWHPDRAMVLLYAFALPPLPAGASYRVRLGFDDGRFTAGPALAPGPRGDVVLPIQLFVGAARLREVQVVRDPSAEPVLAGRTAVPAG